MEKVLDCVNQTQMLEVGEGHCLRFGEHWARSREASPTATDDGLQRVTEHHNPGLDRTP